MPRAAFVRGRIPRPGESPDPPGARMTAGRADRLYLGYQYATPYPEPGPLPRRPTPQDQERVNPDWATAQRREENQLNRPLQATFATAAVARAGRDPRAGRVDRHPAGRARGDHRRADRGRCGYALARGAALRARMADERSRVGKLREAQESQLFAWQAEHASRVREWQALRIAYEHQKRWYAVACPAASTGSTWRAAPCRAGPPCSPRRPRRLAAAPRSRCWT